MQGTTPATVTGMENTILQGVRETPRLLRQLTAKSGFHRIDHRVSGRVGQRPSPDSRACPCEYYRMLPPRKMFNWLLNRQTGGSQRIAPRLAASAASGNWLEMEMIGPYPRLTESETPGVGPRSLCF